MPIYPQKMLSPTKKLTGLRKPLKPLPLPPEVLPRPDAEPVTQQLQLKALPQRPLPPAPSSRTMSSTLTIARRPVGAKGHERDASAVSATSVYSDTPGMPQRLMEDDALPKGSRMSSDSQDLSGHESNTTDDDKSVEAFSNASGRRYSSSISSSHSSPPRPEIWRRRSVKSERSVNITDLKLTTSNDFTIYNSIKELPSAPPQQPLPPLPPKNPERLVSLSVNNSKRKPVPARPAPPQPDTMGKNISKLFKAKSKDKLRQNAVPQQDSVPKPLPLPPRYSPSIETLPNLDRGATNQPSEDLRTETSTPKPLPPNHSRELSDTPTVTPEYPGMKSASSYTAATVERAVGSPSTSQAIDGISSPGASNIVSPLSASPIFAPRQSHQKDLTSSRQTNSSPTSRGFTAHPAEISPKHAGRQRTMGSQSPVSPTSPRARVDHQYTTLPLASQASRSSPSRPTTFETDRPLRPRPSVPRLPVSYSPSSPSPPESGPKLVAQPSPNSNSSPINITSPVVARGNIDGLFSTQMTPTTLERLAANNTMSFSDPAPVSSPKSAAWPFDKLTPAAPGMIAPAPKLLPYMPSCFAAHRNMRNVRNDSCPVGCMMCEKMDREKRFVCTFCDLSCCKDCMGELTRTPTRDLKTCLDRLQKSHRLPAPVVMQDIY